jgi:2-desacetyl-2-hydroxyethyl bacteriochlorophyllide A dehydrogenase
MLAAVLENWEHLAVKDVNKPILETGEAIVRILFAGVCGSDITVYSGKHPTATVPCVIGHEIIGNIEEIRSNTSVPFKIGDRITVDPLISCGICEACVKGYRNVCKNLKLIGIHENGGYAEFTKASIDMLVKLPDSLSDRIAALAEPFAVGFHVVSRSELKRGDTVLIVGAGPIGLIVAIAAKNMGASRIVISEINEKRLALAQSLGFDTINAKTEDVMKQVGELTNGNGFDIVFEVSGSKAGILLTTSACKIHGTIVPLSLSGAAVEFELGKVSFKEMRVIGTRVYSRDDFENGVYFLERMSKEYDLNQLITDIVPLKNAQMAIDSMKSGSNTGKILIDCQRHGF